jgi:hypothetical protein
MSVSLSVLAVAVVASVVWLVVKSRSQPFGAFIDMSKPPWSDAVAKARQSIPVLRELFPANRDRVGVKYPLQTSGGETEHVWGQLRELGPEFFVAGLDTPLLRGKPLTEPPYTLSLSELEDWQLEMPDGSIRGGYTTRLDIKLARESGRPIPAHMQSMESRFVDG